MNFRSSIKRWTPPALIEARRRYAGRSLRFDEVQGGWAEALKQSSGYAAESIVERVGAATREVVAGRALYERDSVLFHEPDYPFPIVAALLRAALAGGGRLHVIDVGGSLGSTYRQCRPLLNGVSELRWCVVEQPSFVAMGRREFSTDELCFAPSIHDLPPRLAPSLILLSSVLQYLEEPKAMLHDLLSLAADYLVLDRTPMSMTLTQPRLCIQHAPKSIYEASYPCWILSRLSLLASLRSAGWQLVAEYENSEGAFETQTGVGLVFRGLLAERQGMAP